MSALRIISNVLTHSTLFQIFKVIFVCQELQSAVWEEWKETYHMDTDTWEPWMPAISGRSI